MDEIFASLTSKPQAKGDLQRRLLIEPEVFDRALEKLWTHGGAAVDYAENVARGDDDWRESYLLQGEQKREQIERMIRYAESNLCRVASVVRHFGDLADSQKPCGICDHCAPPSCIAQRFRTATKREHAALQRVIDELRAGGAKATGRLYENLFPAHDMTRDDFEDLLGAMARAGIVRLTEAVFEKNGREIPFRKVNLTRSGHEADVHTPFEFVMKDREPLPTPPRRRKKPKRPTPGKTVLGPGELVVTAAKVQRVPDVEADRLTAEALRAWRLSEARRLRVPAFRIFTDRALDALVRLRPRNITEMVAVPGIGLRTAEKYGEQIHRVLHGAARSSKPDQPRGN